MKIISTAVSPGGCVYRTGKGRRAGWRVILLIPGLLAVGAASAVHAQIQADAQLTGQSAGGGLYTYNITLNNLGSSSSGIQTFWYSWVPGADFLPTSPTSVQAPAGWMSSVQGGPYYDPYGYYYPDGYSIEFTTSTTPLNPGSSLTFGFMSTDSPAALAGNSPIFTYYPVGTSYVFSGVGESGLGLQFVVQSVPEPSSLALLTASIGLWSITRRGRRAAANRRVR